MGVNIKLYRELVDSVANNRDEGVPEYHDVIGCSECGKPMTDTERHYFEFRCEGCEILWFERVEAWRLKESVDEDLDDIYGLSEPDAAFH